MSQIITRRQLLSHGIKTGVGLMVLRNLSLSAAPTIAISEITRLRDDRFQAACKRLDDFVARHMIETGAPGLTLALADRNGLIRASQYGYADVKVGVRVAPQTLFEIGSISKSFVGLAAVQLAEEGKLDLHKPVAQYLPWLKIESSYPPFTTHHLLSHTSGLPAVPLLMRVATTTLRTGFAPGTRFVYSNIGYVLLGLLIEAVDRRPFAEVIHKRVFEPLGMSTSEPVINNSIRERLAVGYRPFYEDRPFPHLGKLAEAPWLEVPEAAGSIASTATDMGAYLRMLLTKGVSAKGRLLSERGFESFIKPVIKAPFRGEDASYAYGLWISETDGHTLLRHTGGMVAFSSAMYADLSDGFGAFASVNAQLDGGYRPVVVTRYALDLLSATTRARELPPMPPPPSPPDRIKNASDYAGTFTSPDGNKLVMSANGEQLIMQHADQRIILEQAGRDRFIVKHPDFELFALNFGREKDVVVEASHGSLWWTNDRYSGPKTFAYPRDWEAYIGHYNADSPWYGSTRVVNRKGKLFIDGEQPLAPITAGVFRPEGDLETAERITFDGMLNGQATRMNYSGIEFFRTFTP